jgi:hypothetical protein
MLARSPPSPGRRRSFNASKHSLAHYSTNAKPFGIRQSRFSRFDRCNPHRRPTLTGASLRKDQERQECMERSTLRGLRPSFLYIMKRCGRLSTFDRAGIVILSILGTCMGLMIGLASDIRLTLPVALLFLALLFPGVLVGMIVAPVRNHRWCPGLWRVERCCLRTPAVRLVSIDNGIATENSRLVRCPCEFLGLSWSRQ